MGCVKAQTRLVWVRLLRLDQGIPFIFLKPKIELIRASFTAMWGENFCILVGVVFIPCPLFQQAILRKHMQCFKFFEKWESNPRTLERERERGSEIFSFWQWVLWHSVHFFFSWGTKTSMNYVDKSEYIYEATC